MPGFEEAYYRAFALLNAGRVEEAIAASRALVSRDPQAPLVHLQLGRALRKGKYFGDAEIEFAKALSLSPSLAEAAFDLGAVLEARSDLAGAEAWYRKAVAINPAYPEAHVGIARLRRAAGDVSGARAEIMAAIELAPSDELYKQLLASLDAGAGTGK